MYDLCEVTVLAACNFFHFDVTFLWTKGFPPPGFWAQLISGDQTGTRVRLPSVFQS